MLSHIPSILQLTSLLHQHGIQDVVLCPGSRNAPICHTLSQTGLFRCHPITDERSAGFFAIGTALATQRPVAVCVTSGSALVNLHPAVCEAFYQQVPLVVISADRPAAWIGQMDGQTLPQPGVFGSMAKMSVTLPECHDKTEEWYCNRLINEALLACTHHVAGPVHLNVPLSEPLYEFTADHLPTARLIQRGSLLDTQLLDSHLQGCRHACILIGQMPPHQLESSLLEQVSLQGYCLIGETLSNASPLDANPSEIDWDRMPHLDLVITLGGHVIHKAMKQWLRANPPKEHWHVSPEGNIADLFCCQTLCVESTPKAFLQKMTRHGMEHLTLPRLTAAPIPSVVSRLLDLLPDNAVLHLANSSTVRYAQHHKIPPTITVCCNRGINGIEGSMSSAVGYASATPERPNFLVIGDLSFFYDQNALWNTQLPHNLHILLLNNGGGGIFNTLPIPSDDESQRIIRASHTTTACSVARQYGLDYLYGEEHLETFVHFTSSIILEVRL